MSWSSRARVLVGLSVIGLPACELDRPDPPHNLVLVTLDTTRADVLDGGAGSVALAPRIASLEENGVRFPRAYSVAPLTLPAHASLLTGLLPPRHGVRVNGVTALPEAASTLAEHLADEGYRTAAFVSALVLDRGFGLAQGFATYDQPSLAAYTRGEASAERPAAVTAAAAARWIDELPDGRPFFLWLHLYDAHSPYQPTAEHLARAGGDPYRGEIVALDDAVGIVLDALEESDRSRETLVALTADHGEGLGEHGERLHGSLCYESTVRVPLLLRFPAPPPRPGPVRIASQVDVMPTLLGRLGVSVPEGLDGLDLFAPDFPADRGVYFEALAGWRDYGWSPLAGWVDWQGKYLHSSQPEFYGIQRDPLERVDLAPSRQRECTAARAYIAEILERPSLEREALEPGDGLRAALSALGYARGQPSSVQAPALLEPTDRPSPRSRIEELEPLRRASDLYEAGRYSECRWLVAEIVRENPGHLVALDYLGLCLMHAREFERARAVWKQRLGQSEVADGLLNLGLCELRADALLPDSAPIQAALRRVRPPLGR